MRLSASVLVAVVALAAAGCGGSKQAPESNGAPARQQVRVYFLQDGKLAAVSRSVDPALELSGALRELAQGPATGERRSGLDSAVPRSGGATSSPGKTKGSLVLRGAGGLSRPALAQVVYTLTQFPEVRTVDGLDRSDFEGLTPAILVESPAFEGTVRSPLHVTGTANTFEATFRYELKASDGRVLAKHFVTASSGNGQRGTFDFTVTFAVADRQPGKLVVYEDSAADGSRIHVRETPLTLAP